MASTATPIAEQAAAAVEPAASAPAPPAYTPALADLVRDANGRVGIVADVGDDGFPDVAWLPPAAPYQLELTKA